MKNEEYYAIAGWMVNELELSGNELLCYAIVYHYSQLESHEFYGSLSFLSESLRCSKSTAQKALQCLVDKGLIIKRNDIFNGVTYAKYSAIGRVYRKSVGYTENDEGVYRKSVGGIPKIGTNNKNTDKIYINTIEDKSSMSEISDERVDISKLVDWFNETTKGVFGRVRLPFSETRSKMLNARLRQYGKKAFVEVVENAMQSSFLIGNNHKGFTATFDWLIRPTNFEKVLSGNYDNRNQKDTNSKILYL